MKKIYEPDTGYRMLRPLVDWYVKHSFSKIKYVGMENLPKDGSIIFAPNHCDALMDPLAVLSMDPGQKVFVARADIFKKPTLFKILTFLKIMPIHRVRDGFRNVLNTEDTIEKSIEVLNNQVPFCILPEGMHRSKHSLLPMGKGISRIAFGTVKQRMEGAGPVYIVPVGLEYSDYYRYRSTLLAHVGKPIDVTRYIESSDRNDQLILSDIRNMTAEALRELIVFIPDDEYYEATWELAKMSSGHVPEFRLQKRFEENRKAVAQIQALRAERPEAARKLFDKAMDYAQARRNARVSGTVTYTRRPLLSALLRTLVALLWLPLALVQGICSLPGWVTAEVLAAGVKDPTFRNSFRCVALLVVWTLVLLVWTIVLFCTVKWYIALAAVLLLIPAPLWTYDYFEWVRRTVSSWRWLSNPRLRRQKDDLMDGLKNI